MFQWCYATAVYLLIEIDGKPNIEFTFGKLRIARKNLISIPRLELLDVLVGIRSLKFVQESLKLPVIKKFLWTNSQCFCNRIKSKKPLPRFVYNKLTEIREDQEIEFWYVGQNGDEWFLVAWSKVDSTTRGISPKWKCKDYHSEHTCRVGNAKQCTNSHLLSISCCW